MKYTVYAWRSTCYKWEVEADNEFEAIEAAQMALLTNNPDIPATKTEEGKLEDWWAEPQS